MRASLRWTLGMALVVASMPARAQGYPQFGVRIPMRDGVRLVANIWVPDTVGRFPTILLRTPYDKTGRYKRYKLAEYVKRGYAVVLQDTRGRGDSEGTFHFYFPEGKDGYDTIEWIARQRWSDGKVGTDGGSYLGTVQWLAARERPPHLACIIPDAPSGRLFDEIPYQGGAFHLEWALEWINGTSEHLEQNALDEVIDYARVSAHRPLITMDEVMGRRMPLYREFLTHSTLDAYWAPLNFTAVDFKKIGIPALTVTGWFDGDQSGALSYWDGAAKSSPGFDRHFLIIGPWTHAQTYLGGDKKVGYVEIATEGTIDIQGIRLQFYDYCLKGAKPTFEQPKVQVYLTGSNRWIKTDRYPVPGVSYKKLFLHSDGGANTGAGNGRLTWDEPGAEKPDHYRYDPKNPVPSHDPTDDHQQVETREDMLVYSTEVLKEPVSIVGRVFVNLVAASDGLDTDFTAGIFDVYPDGRAISLGPAPTGARRARYRHGYAKEIPLVPGQADSMAVELFDIGHTFLPGHRIRIHVSSSAFPYLNANQNTGGPVATDTQFRVATNTIYHEPGKASHVWLPVLPERP